ncbi:MAG: TlpA family protein disulfide reductase [Flavobacteriaceae bacterium]
MYSDSLKAQGVSSSGMAVVGQDMDKFLEGYSKVSSQAAKELKIDSTIIVIDAMGQRLQGAFLEQLLQAHPARHFYMDPSGNVKICVIQAPFPIHSSMAKGRVMLGKQGIDRWSDAATVLSDAWVGKELPTFQLADMNSRKISSKKLEGKVVVMHFWSARSRICRSELPQLNSLAERYRHRKDVTFISLAIDNKMYLHDLLRQQPLHFPLIPEAGLLAMENFGVGPVPTYMIADRHGTIRHVSRGYAPGNIQRLAHQLNGVIHKKNTFHPKLMN